MERLALILPSNSPEHYREFMGSPDSIAALVSGFEGKLIVGAALQEPWLHEEAVQMEEQLAEAGIDCHWMHMDRQVPPPPMAMLRETAAAMTRDFCDAFLLVDDNLVFRQGTKKFPRSAGAAYWSSMQYLAANPSCGSVQHQGSFGGNGWGYDCRPTQNGSVSTSFGLMVRNVPWSNGFTWPREVMDARGPLEETALVYGMIERGYYHARTFNVAVRHRPAHLGSDNAVHSFEASYDGCGRWVRARYDAHGWEHDDCKFPRRLREMHRTAAAQHGWEAKL